MNCLHQSRTWSIHLVWTFLYVNKQKWKIQKISKISEIRDLWLLFWCWWQIGTILRGWGDLLRRTEGQTNDRNIKTLDFTYHHQFWLKLYCCICSFINIVWGCNCLVKDYLSGIQNIIFTFIKILWSNLSSIRNILEVLCLPVATLSRLTVIWRKTYRFLLVLKNYHLLKNQGKSDESVSCKRALKVFRNNSIILIIIFHFYELIDCYVDKGLSVNIL